jgi:hypothetical protein
MKYSLLLLYWFCWFQVDGVYHMIPTYDIIPRYRVKNNLTWSWGALGIGKPVEPGAVKTQTDPIGLNFTGA